MSEEIPEGIEEQTTPSVVNDGETSVETPEEVKPLEPGDIKYTEAVEKKIGKVKSQQYKAEAERDLYKQRLEQLETAKVEPEHTTPSFS